jgi:hypothetical protein
MAVLPAAGRPLDDQALGLASGAGVFGFGITSPEGNTPVIMTASVIYQPERGVSDLARHPRVALCRDQGASVL